MFSWNRKGDLYKKSIDHQKPGPKQKQKRFVSGRVLCTYFEKRPFCDNFLKARRIRSDNLIRKNVLVFHQKPQRRADRFLGVDALWIIHIMIVVGLNA